MGLLKPSGTLFTNFVPMVWRSRLIMELATVWRCPRAESSLKLRAPESLYCLWSLSPEGNRRSVAIGSQVIFASPDWRRDFMGILPAQGNLV